MAPQFSPMEKSLMTSMAGLKKTPVQIQARLSARREGLAKQSRIKKSVKVKKSMKAFGPDLTSVRRFLAGSTHNRARVERRGAKKKLTPRQVQKLDTACRNLYAKTKGEVEVHWDDILEKAGLAGVVHPTTAQRSLVKASYKLQARVPREKPCRTAEHEEIRERICKKWGRYRENYFSKDIKLEAPPRRGGVCAAKLRTSKKGGWMVTRSCLFCEPPKRTSGPDCIQCPYSPNNSSR